MTSHSYFWCALNSKFCPCSYVSPRVYKKRACNFHSDCTVGKILIVVAKNNDKCVGGAKWKLFSSPVNATLVLVGVFLA